MSDLEKDAAIQQLGAVEECVKHGLQGDITPPEQTGHANYWRPPKLGRAFRVSEEMKAAYRALYSGLKISILNAVPEAQNLHDRLTNLYAAKSDLEIC